MVLPPLFLMKVLEMNPSALVETHFWTTASSLSKFEQSSYSTGVEGLTIVSGDGKAGASGSSQFSPPLPVN